MKEDFINLGLNEKANYLWDKGTLISHINYYGKKVCLYAAEGKFYELFLNESELSIDDIKLLDRETRLKLYADNIDIKRFI